MAKSIVASAEEVERTKKSLYNQAMQLGCISNSGLLAFINIQAEVISQERAYSLHLNRTFCHPKEPECEHKDKNIGYDSVKCTSCGMIKTDHGSDWGVAKNMWFDNIEDANFYKQFGRYPEKR